MEFSLPIPTPEDHNSTIKVKTGEILFVIGQNGVGKSRFIQKCFAQFPKNAARITAHRTSWLSGNSVSLTSSEYSGRLEQLRGHDQNLASAYQDFDPQLRNSLIIFDLVEAENERARRIAEAVDKKNFHLASAISKDNMPAIKTMNELLKQSNLPITITLADRGILVAQKNGGPEYGVQIA